MKLAIKKGENVTIYQTSRTSYKSYHFLPLDQDQGDSMFRICIDRCFLELQLQVPTEKKNEKKKIRIGFLRMMMNILI